MKKIKWLIVALCGLMCTAIAACDLSGLTGMSGSLSDSTATDSKQQSVEDDSSKSEEVSDDTALDSENDTTSDSESISSPDTSSLPDNESESSSEIMSGPDTPAPPESSEGDSSSPDGGDEIPESKMVVNVQFYTIVHNDKPLIYSGLVDKNATLKDFFDTYMGDMVALYNEGNESQNEDAFFYDADFLKEGFWQVGERLMYENSRLAENNLANVTEVNMMFTPSGAGMNIGICACGDPLNCVGYASIPFPIGVRIADFVNWANKKGIFPMTYEQSITQGYWTEAGYGERLTDEYVTLQSVLCFVYGQGEEVLPEDFNVYMSAVYKYELSEMGKVGAMDVNDVHHVVSAGTVTVKEAYETAYGASPDYTFHYYMDGVQVSEDTILTKDCAVVCVLDSIDTAIPEFTITVYMDGRGRVEYAYTRPVTMRDAIVKYCEAMGIKMTDYSWKEPESQMASFDINTAWAYDIEIYGYTYVEPEKPTAKDITVWKYDGETETKETYAVPFEMKSGEFIRESLFPAFDKDNPFDGEYVFYICSMQTHPLYGDEIFEYENNILMIKKSVLDAGYTVNLDFMNRGDSTSQEYERTYNEPKTIRELIYDMSSWDGIDPMTFQITINGQVLNVGEGKIIEEYEIYPRYKDMTVVVRPIYEVSVNVNTKDERDKTKTVFFYGGLSLPAIAQAVGLTRDFSAYAWKIGYYSEYYWDESGFFMTSEYYVSVTIEARRVYTNFYFVNAEGMEIHLEANTYDDYATYWEWAVDVKTAFDGMIGNDEMNRFDDFTWIAKSVEGEFAVTANDVLSYLASDGYNYGEMSMSYKTVYSLIGTRKTVTVRVEENNMNGQTEKGEQVYEAGLTVGDILSGYGYTQADISWLMVDPLCGYSSDNFPMEWTWDSVVTWPIKICVFLNN